MTRVQRKLTHNDITPRNVLIERRAGGGQGRASLAVCLIDFGIAKDAGSSPVTTYKVSRYAPPRVTPYALWDGRAPYLSRWRCFSLVSSVSLRVHATGTLGRD